jgi:hypothetical protein
MIHIAKFDTDFAGRKFKDDRGNEYTWVGYGSNAGTPYLVGLTQDGGKPTIRTVLVKNVAEILP